MYQLKFLDDALQNVFNDALRHGNFPNKLKWAYITYNMFLKKMI